MKSVPLSQLEDTAVTWINDSRLRVSPRTTMRRLSSIKSFASSHRLEILNDYRAPQPGRPVPHPLPEGIAGVRRCISTAPHESHQLVLGLCGLAGLRIREACSLLPDEVSLHDRVARVRGKGDKTRSVPLSSELLDIIGPRVAEGGSARLVSLSDSAARRAVSQAGIRAHLARPIASHDLRATFATELYRRTGDIRLVQEILGHASVQTTQIYIEVLMGAKHAAVEFD